jgi:hypothetical protein
VANDRFSVRVGCDGRTKLRRELRIESTECIETLPLLLPP